MCWVVLIISFDLLHRFFEGKGLSWFSLKEHVHEWIGLNSEG